MKRPLEFELHSITPDDREFVREELVRNWFSTVIWSRDIEYRADELPGLIAWLGDQRIGLVTVGAPASRETEIVTLSARIENRGVGAALLSGAVEQARSHDCRRVLLTTSNDNLRALGFYQRRGWRLVQVHRGMIDRYRAREKQIPEMGLNNIPLRDEIELELLLRD